MKKEFKSGKYEIDFNNFKSAYVINKRLDLNGVTGNNFTHGRKWDWLTLSMIKSNYWFLLILSTGYKF